MSLLQACLISFVFVASHAFLRIQPCCSVNYTKSFSWWAHCHRCHCLCHNSTNPFHFLPWNCHHVWPQSQLLAWLTLRIILQMGQPRTRVPAGMGTLPHLAVSSMRVWELGPAASSSHGNKDSLSLARLAQSAVEKGIFGRAADCSHNIQLITAAASDALC